MNGPLRQSSSNGTARGGAAALDPARPPDGAAYVCPMHPQIRQAGPGVCPICGMSLEPERAVGDPPANAELADFTRRLWVGIALTTPVFALEMGRHLLGHRMTIPERSSAWIQFALATPVVLWAGWPVLVRVSSTQPWAGCCRQAWPPRRWRCLRPASSATLCG